MISETFVKNGFSYYKIQTVLKSLEKLQVKNKTETVFFNKKTKKKKKKSFLTLVKK